MTWRQDAFESATYPQHSHRQSPVQPCKQRNEAAETLEARPNAVTGKVQKHKQRRYQMSAKCRPSQSTQWHLQRKTKMKPREGFDMSARFVTWLSRAACAQDKLTTAMHAGGYLGFGKGALLAKHSFTFALFAQGRSQAM